MKTSRSSSFVAAVGEKKLYVLLGVDHRLLGSVDEDYERFGHVDWNRCGEVYDIEDNTWNYLNLGYIEFLDYAPLTFHTASVNGEDDELAGVTFFDLHHPLLYFDFRKQTVKVAPDFYLSGCTKAFSHTNHLGYAVINYDMVFDNNTFYWFTRDLLLYGYDICCQTWFISPSLIDEFHIREDLPIYPRLACLGNGIFLAIVDEPGHHGSFTMASFTAHKDKYEGGNCFLSVSMKSLQAFSIDNQDFYPLTAKAKKLKNTAMREQPQVMDNNWDFLSYQKVEED